MNILVGANGAGKSNFIRVMELLGRIVDGRLGYYVELLGGASAVLRQPGGERIHIQVNGDAGSYRAVLEATNDDRFVLDRV